MDRDEADRLLDGYDAGRYGDEVPDTLLRRLATVTPEEGRNLSPWELLALRFASHGLNSSETAEATGKEPGTVQEQIKQARRKLGAKTTAQAVAIALRREFIV